jgi:hypothetical protein
LSLLGHGRKPASRRREWTPLGDEELPRRRGFKTLLL